MSTEYFSSVVMNQTIDMVLKGLRDLRSADLSPFYEQPEAVPAGYTTETYPRVREEMLDNELPVVSQPAFSSQLSDANGQELFVEFLGDAGLVQTESGDDFTQEAHADSLPDLGDIGDLLTRLSDEGVVTLDVERIREIAELVNIPRPPGVLNHLLIPDPDPIGELEPIISRRFARMRQYLRSYFSTE